MNEPSGFLQPLLGAALPWLYVDSVAWTVVGLLGNALFGSRFLVQWLYSERKKQLLVPPAFWHLSFWGSIVQVFYALHVDKLPLLLSFGLLPFIYSRNLILLRRGRIAAGPGPGTLAN